MKRLLTISVPGLCALLALAAGQSCTSNGKKSGTVSQNNPPDAMPPAPPSSSTFCGLPGSVVWTAQGPSVVPGADASTPDMSWLTVPPGFCTHYFGTLGHVRQLRFAPDGDLFGSSPTTATAGGNFPTGTASVSILPDDDGDGVAESAIAFLSDLPSTQGIMFANGSFYFQDSATIRSVPFTAGDRSPSAPPQAVTTIAAPQDEVHWTKVMDVARDGTIYITNGGSQDDQCLSTDPTRGSIFALGDGGATSLVAKGFRNPIALRCESNHDVCLAIELGLDFSSGQHGREKLVPVRAGDNWGFPCCATKGVPYQGTVYGDNGASPDCSGVAAEDDSFVIGQTPFGLDFEPGKWPAPWGGSVFVTLHGQVGSWEGSRVVAIALDPNSGVPLPATDLGDGGPTPTSMLTFASGWDDGSQAHGRAASIAFAPDGRVFLGDDHGGLIVWIAPVDLAKP